MILYCGKCCRLTDHGDPKDHGAYATSTKKLRKGRWEPSRKNGIARRITARCLACGFLNNKSGYVVTEANLAAELRGKL